MIGRFFEPDDKICIIIDNENYDKLREIPEFKKRQVINRDKFFYADMPQAREWANEFEERIKDY